MEELNNWAVDVHHAKVDGTVYEVYESYKFSRWSKDSPVRSALGFE